MKRTSSLAMARRRALQARDVPLASRDASYVFVLSARVCTLDPASRRDSDMVYETACRLVEEVPDGARLCDLYVTALIDGPGRLAPTDQETLTEALGYVPAAGGTWTHHVCC